MSLNLNDLLSSSYGYQNVIQGSNNFFSNTLLNSPNYLQNMSYSQMSKLGSNLNTNTGGGLIGALSSIVGNNSTNKFDSVLKNISGDGKGFQNILGGAKDLFSKGGLKNAVGGLKGNTDVVGLAEAGIGMGLNALGVKQADKSLISGFDKGLDVAAKHAQYIPGVGQVASLVLKGANLINKYGGATTDKQGTDTAMNLTGRDFQQSQNAGKKLAFSDRVVGLFGRNKRSKINTATDYFDKMNLLSSASAYNNQQNSMIANNLQSVIHHKNMNQLLNNNNTRMIAAKDGAKIKRIASKVKVLKKGGKMNIIPDGAFHSRKNNLPDEIAKDVTSKGIPVITKEGEEIIQHAEIEKNEIIFHKELTNKLESLLKDYNEAKTQVLKDKIATKAGRLLTREILYNTKDNTGLMDKIE